MVRFLVNRSPYERTSPGIGVEDDEDLRQFIRSILEEDYEVHEASNGVEGFEKHRS